MKQHIEDLIHKTLVADYDKYYKLAYRYMKNESDALDAVQESAYKAILRSASIKQADYVSTWIYRIVINTCLDMIKKNSREITDENLPEASACDTSKDFDLEKAIDALEPLEKTIIVLRFFEELKLEQIAEITGENLNTIKTKLYRTLKKLRITIT